MWEIERFILNDDNHKDSNCVVITIICNGDDKGHLYDVNNELAWCTELFVGHLSNMGTLVGKPKILTIQSCRGCQYFQYSKVEP